LATYNANGLQTQDHVANLLLVARGGSEGLGAVDVLVVQETWVGTTRGQPQARLELWVAQLAAAAGEQPPQVFWAHNTSDPAASAGVAVLVRRALITSGALQLGAVQRSDSGRLLVLPMRWGGHDLHLATVYMPPYEAGHRRAFIADELTPAVAAVPAGSLVLLGDFNYVLDARLDRANAAGTVGASEPATDAALQQVLAPHGSVDVWREVRGQVAGGYTLVRAGAQSRIDRVYLPRALLRHVSGLAVWAPHGSDHCPLAFSLAAMQPLPPLGPGLRPISPAFLQHEDWRARLLACMVPHVAHGMALPPAELLGWWPRFKRTLRDVTADLAAEHKRELLNTTAEAAQAARAWQEAQERMERTPHDDQQQFQRAFAAAAAARAQHRQQVVGAARAWAGGVVDGWVHGREQPAPAVTMLVRPRPPAQPVAELVGADGAPVRDASAMAARFCAHFAAVSAAQPADLPARTAVFAAIQRQQQHGLARTMDAAAAAQAGRAAVTPDEVRQALNASARSKASGPDRLPMEVWAAGDGVWAPLLARVYSAMMECGRTPRGFLDGAVAAFHKRGDERDVANYRPIQLLNTDYRVLAKVLATRFGTAMRDSIGVEQSAFLPGRQIGDNIRLAQLLPAVLAAQQQQAALVFLDIAKAYDTVDRGFLFAAMEAHGADAGMVAWARLLLSDTWAVAVANGRLSRRRRWEAGVRQGCPLSPALYLFVTEALACWLREQPHLGVDCAGQRVVSQHHADDAKVWLRDASDAGVQRLNVSMETFSRASHQRNNVGKSAAVLVGVVPAGAPASLGGVRVVSEHLALGVVHTNVSMPVGAAQPYPLRAPQLPQEAPPVLPQGQHPPVWQRRLAAFTAMTHRVVRLPASAMGRGLWLSSYGLSTFLYHAEHEGAPARVLEEARDLAAAAVDRPFTRMPGVHSHLLAGSPVHGGFGLLPLVPHVRALHLAMATALVSGLVAAELDGVPLQPWVRVAAAALQLVVPNRHPLQLLAVAAHSTLADVEEGRLTGMPTQQARIPQGPLRRMAQALARAGPLAQAHAPPAGVRVPQPWDLPVWLRARQGRMEVARVCHLLGWAQPGGASHLSFARGRVAVRAARRLLVGDMVQASRAEEWERFARQARVEQPGAPQARVGTLVREAWRAPVEGRVKEVFFRLTLNGVNAAGGHDILFTTPCACGYVAARGQPSQVHRAHAFWDCPVAEAVRAQLQAGMPPACQVQRHHVWLLRSPDEQHCTGAVWRVVAMVALQAMELGRAALWSARQRLLHGDLPAGATPLQVAQRQAVGRFWLLLMDVAAMSTRMEDWPGLTPQHPFLGPRAPGTGFGVLEARVPVAAPVPLGRRRALPRARDGG
jgi:exonuclease III